MGFDPPKKISLGGPAWHTNH